MHGKDRSPEETIRNITQILKRAGLSVEEVSWKHPVPHVWSVHVREKNCHALCVNGKGTTKALALASALGEFMERLITGYFFSDFALPGLPAKKKFLFSPDELWFTQKKISSAKNFLTKNLRNFYNPTGEVTPYCLVDRMLIGHKNDAILCLPFQRTRDKEIVYFPVNILDNLYASNGMAAGNTEEEACVQALSEILERYVKTTIIRKGISLPSIPERFYSGLVDVVKALDALKAAGFRVLVKDASFGGRYPVVNVTIIEKKTKKCFLSFGAHPSFEIALMRTVTELLQGQKLAAFRGLKKAEKNKKEVRDRSNLVSHFIDSSGLVSEDFFKKKPAYHFKHFDFRGTRKEEKQFLLSIFSKAKKDVYINSLSIDGFFILRVVVPGWSEIYHPEDLVYSNSNRGRFFVNSVMNLASGKKTTLRKTLSLIDSGTVGENEIVADVLGIALNKESPWKRLCFGELKLLVLLALGKKHSAYTQLEWCFDVGCIREKMNPVYECLGRVLDKKNTAGFSKNILYQANKLFNGMDVFSDLFSPGGIMLGTQSHKKILTAFLKSRRIM